MVLPFSAIVTDVAPSSNAACAGIESWLAHGTKSREQYQGTANEHSLWRPRPENCPVRMHIPGEGCEFTCVNGSLGSCTNPAMNVADLEKSKCRSCEISGCQVCSPDNLCKECATGFYLTEDENQCHSQFAFFVPCVSGIVGLLLLTFMSWYIWLRKQPTVNTRVLKRAIMRRRHMTLRDHTTRQHLWYPLSINLCTARSEDGHIVGGRALLMFFSFQAFVLVWCVVALLFWLLCSIVSNSQMLNEGKVSGVKEDIFSICHATLRRHSTKMGKLIYTATLYVFTTIATFLYAVWQRRRRIRLDTDEATMKDFTVMLKGFPCETGNQVEHHRLDFVRKTTGRQPIGVSICWEYNHEEVTEILARETWLWGKARDSCGGGGEIQATMPPDNRGEGCGPMRYFFQYLTQFLATPAQQEADADLGKARRHEERATLAAANAVSTGCMYVVFRSEAERDHARQIFSSKTERPLYNGQRIKFEVSGSGSEPESVLWHNFSKAQGVPCRAALSVLAIAGSIVLWGLLFYFPFAIYEAWSYSALGAASDTTTEMIFSMLVVAGNQILYLLCEKASRFICFRFVGHQLTAYIWLYTMALLCNLAMDLVILFYTTQLAMANLGLEITTATFLMGTDEVTTFPMRAKLGARLKSYNFPACFFLPFLFEALFTVVIPYHIYKTLVGSQPIRQRAADGFLMPAPFDMSRYADVVLNMTQATMSLFFSPGYVLPTLGGMLFGHIFVYAWDHYRVLRHVRKFRITSFGTEKAAERMLALPGASLIAGTVLQTFQVGAVTPSNEFVAGLSVVGAVAAHITIHLLVLQYIVLWVGRAEHRTAESSYEEVASTNPGNWFNMNPIHCLRSRYVHKHDPPCIFYQIGKEHLLEPNPKLGLFYSAPEWNNEQPSTFVELTQLARRSLATAIVPIGGQLHRPKDIKTGSVAFRNTIRGTGEPSRASEPAERTESPVERLKGAPKEMPRKSMVTFACDDEE